METRFDCLTDRPSWLESVFCRVTCWREEDEEVEAREAGCSIVMTDISSNWVSCATRQNFLPDEFVESSDRKKDVIYDFGKIVPGLNRASTSDGVKRSIKSATGK